MYHSGLLLGGFNPPHYGHIELVKAALERTEAIRILIGTRPNRKYQLPFEVRYRALNAGIKEASLDSKVMIYYPRVPVFEVDVSSYGLSVMGSDVFNLLGPHHKKLHPNDREFFSRFNTLFVLERAGLPIDQLTLESVQSQHQVEVATPRSSISSTDVRTAYREGRSVDNLVPPSVKIVVDPYTHLFQTED